MFDYLQQFNRLPKDLRDKVSSPVAMAALAELEEKYKVDLAMAVMKVMIKSLAVKDLPSYFIGELSLTPDVAKNLAAELKEKIFFAVAGYLNLEADRRALDLDKDIGLLLKKAGLVLASSVLEARFKSILSTYLRGVRSKIDTRAVLAKSAKIGGLNLSAEEIDRIFKVCEETSFSSLAVSPAVSGLSTTSGPTPSLRPPATRLDKIMAAAESAGAAVKSAEYDLRQALAKGKVKKPAALDVKHELPATEEEPELPAAKPEDRFGLQPVAPASLRPLPSRPPSTPPSTAKPQATAARPAPAPAVLRPQMHDIKPMPKVMGPVEELQFLDLVNFRRLGKTPAESTAKIFGKIKLLEAEGYDKMIAGVYAWRQSPVNRFYLALTKDAINKGLPLAELLTKRRQENKETLAEEEIGAIIALNNKLLF